MHPKFTVVERVQRMINTVLTWMEASPKNTKILKLRECACVEHHGAHFLWFDLCLTVTSMLPSADVTWGTIGSNRATTDR